MTFNFLCLIIDRGTVYGVIRTCGNVSSETVQFVQTDGCQRHTLCEECGRKAISVLQVRSAVSSIKPSLEHLLSLSVSQPVCLYFCLTLSVSLSLTLFLSLNLSLFLVLSVSLSYTQFLSTCLFLLHYISLSLSLFLLTCLSFSISLSPTLTVILSFSQPVSPSLPLYLSLPSSQSLYIFQPLSLSL